MKPIIYQASEATTIVMSFLALLITAGLIFFLARGFFKERKRYLEEKEMQMEGVISRSAISSIVTTYIAKHGRETAFSLLYIDLDKFTDFVNAFGQKESEKILERIVKNIESVIPRSTKVARFQQDEFLIFLSGEYDRTDAVDLANKIKAAVARPIKLFGDTQINATGSIAVAFFPVHGSTMKDLVNSLKIATYIVKKNGGNNIRVYSDELGVEGG
ncbi:MAG: GGDEF domain-containing protein, partial [Acholeplasmataceae bacterium]|nr:GGDEF domain-containing protein [Acholeplasmataceae bacterium]